MKGSKIYANAVAKYEEGRLLDTEKLRRIADASYPDALRMLCDYGYGEGLTPEDADLTGLIRAETERLIAFIDEYSCDERLKRYFLLSYKYNDAKAAYKSRFTEVPPSAFYPSLGDFDEAIKSGAYESADLSPAMERALISLDRESEEAAPTSARIDAVLTAAYYEDLLKCAKSLGKRAYASAVGRIDATNVLTVYRCRRSGLDEKAARAMLVKGGKTDEETLMSLLNKDNDPAVAELDLSVPGGRIRKLFEEDDVAYYEAAVEAEFTEFLSGDTENMLTFAPFIGYVTARMHELATVRLMLTLIRNNERDELKRRLKIG